MRQNKFATWENQHPGKDILFRVLDGRGGSLGRGRKEKDGTGEGAEKPAGQGLTKKGKRGIDNSSKKYQGGGGKVGRGPWVAARLAVAGDGGTGTKHQEELRMDRGKDLKRSSKGL